MSVGRIIQTEACIAEGLAYLGANVPQFAVAIDLCPDVPLRRVEDGYDRLLSAIVSQQVSVAAARAIWGKLEAGGFTTQAAIQAADVETLRAHGLSKQKATYAKALADAQIDFIALRNAPTDQVVKTLVEVKGIGVWTAEIYAMFALGRADVFAPGDLALQEAARMLFDLPERPKEKDLRVMAEDWSPWRAVAARLLWAYYHVAKEREGIA